MFSLEALSDACRRLSNEAYSGKSSVYILNGRFYPLLHSESQSYSFPIDELSFIGEYGTPLSSQTILPSIFEFGKLVCDGNAARIFSEI